MTAVAEGAALFAESIDWRSENRRQKSSRGTLTTTGALNLKFVYESRTSNKQARIKVQAKGKVMPGTEYQVDSLDTGWTSGRLLLKDGETIDVSLSSEGENKFKVFVFDDVRGTSTHKIVITRTIATVDPIPASHSISLVVLEKLRGLKILVPLVRKGEQLPKEGGPIRVKAGESLKAGSPHSLNFQLGLMYVSTQEFKSRSSTSFSARACMAGLR